MSERNDAIVLFGATGDLARRELFPALHAIARGGDVPPVVATARQDWSRERLLDRARSGIEEFGGGVDREAFDRLAAGLSYVAGDLTDPGLYGRLADALGGRGRPLHYLSIPPSLFDDAVRGLADAGLAADARVIVEKPFGHDAASARELSATLRQAFPEEAILRIDHFLGLETVQNILVLRFANEVFEPVWNRHHVSHVELTMAEDLGMEGRGAFYDAVGTVRDVVQNHLLQVIAVLAMEPPASSDATDLHGEKVALLRALRPVDPADVVRGQYASYRDEPGVAEGSDTETFVALRLWVDSPRWSGVPFHVRAGKRMATTRTEVVVEFARPPVPLVSDEPAADRLRIEIFPGDAVCLDLTAKQPGEGMRSRRVSLTFDHAPPSRPLAYERLLHDALAGDTTLFGRHEGVVEAWRVVEPALGTGPVHRYDDGSWGPEEARRVAPPGGWEDPRSITRPGASASDERAGR